MIYRFGDCELDDQRYELRRGGEPCHLEPQVFEVLAYLVRHRDRVVPRTELLDEIWGSRFVTDSALTSRVKAARRAIGDSGREQRRDPHRPRPRLPVPRPGRSRATVPPARAGPVGREAELERLGRLLRPRRGGRRQVVFVTGEAGIGKTTLVEAFTGEVGGSGRGWSPAASVSSSGAGQSRTCRSSTRSAACARTTPGRWPCCPGWPRPGWPRCRRWSSPADRAELERRALGGTRERMLREAAEALEAAGADRPLVLVLEDLHWADPSTVDLLEWLARRDTPARLLVVGTYRPADALAGGAPIGDAGAELRLRGLAHELRLGELGPQAVAAVAGPRPPRGRRPRGAGPARAPANRRGPAVRRPARPGLDRRRRPAAGGGPWELAPRPPGDDPRGPRRPPPPARAPARTAGRRRPGHAGGGRGRRRGVRRRHGRGRRARDRRRGRGALRGPGPPRPLPAAHRPGGLAGRDRVGRVPRSPTTSTGRCSTTGSRPAGGPGSTPPSPAGSNGPTGRPPPPMPPSWPPTSWTAVTTPGPCGTSRPPPSRRWVAAPPARPSSTWRRPAGGAAAAPRRPGAGPGGAGRPAVARDRR